MGDTPRREAAGPGPEPDAARYRRFAEWEARGRSPQYERLAVGVAGDPGLLGLLRRLPSERRQPNLLFAAVRFLDGPTVSFDAFREFVLGHADRVLGTMAVRRTQTNEVGRCALVLPLLAGLPGPLALVEVGASAGLCLLLDRYAYDYGGRTVGDTASPVRLACRPRGPVPVPDHLPEVVWRRGIDLDPVDLGDPAGVRWLESCVWPDQPHRLARLRAAAAVARADPPVVVAGDLLDLVGPVVAEAPAEATVVVLSTAVLAYLSPAGRRRFADLMAGLPAVWLSAEGPGALPGLRPPARPDRAVFLLARGPGRLFGVGDPHGAWLRWLGP